MISLEGYIYGALFVFLCTLVFIFFRPIDVFADIIITGLQVNGGRENGA